MPEPGKLPLLPLVASLPVTVPFVAPDELERRRGQRFELRLGANESLFGIAPGALRILQSGHEYLSFYGDPLSFELGHALAERLGVGRGQILVAAGIDDILGLIAQVFVTSGTPVVTSLGAYPTFSYFIANHGGTLHRVLYRAGFNDAEALLETARREQAVLVYLANPDNPTGTLLERGLAQELLAGLPDRCMLVLDEAYADFVSPSALLPLSVQDPRLVRLRTFSKAHGLAGARVGYAIGCPELIQAFDKVRVQFAVNRLGQAAALASLADSAFLEQVQTEVALGRVHYTNIAQQLGLAALPSYTNFVAIDLGSSLRARSAVQQLQDRGCFVRMPGAPPIDRYIRVTVGPLPAREAFARLLAELLPGLPAA